MAAGGIKPLRLLVTVKH